MKPITDGEMKRFNSKWKKKGECHLWLGPLDKDGYGSFFFRRLGRRAHRVAYYIYHGDIMTGMVVDHICMMRNCVNPAHLRSVTVRENALENSRGVGAINAKKTHCRFGHELDKFYGGQRYCSKCEKEKSRRLRAKWKAEDTVRC